MSNRNIQSDSTGVVSITVTVIFIMIISLVVLGFSQVSRRNSRQALDRQLSTQAFYAAESGMNDVMAKIAPYLENGEEVPEQKECVGTYNSDEKTAVGDIEGVEYTCVTVQTKLDRLAYDKVKESSVIVPLNVEGAEPEIGTLHLEWRRSDSAPSTTSLSRCPQPRGGTTWTNFPTASAWANDCQFGLIRIDLVPTDLRTLNDPVAAAQSTMSLALYPRSGNPEDPNSLTYENLPSGANSIFGSGPQGPRVLAASCTEDKCGFDIEGLNFSNGMMRVRSQYVGTRTVGIETEEGQYLTRAQVKIDVTGKAQDVLRRMQVYRSVDGGTARTEFNAFSDYTVQTTGSICKRYVTSPTKTEDLADTTYCSD